MRGFIVLAVLGLILGAALVNQVDQDGGYVYASLGDVVVETSVWFALLAWLISWGLIALLFGAVRRVWGTQRVLSGWMGQRKSRNATALTNRGLISFIEGNWERARTQLLRSARYSDAPLVNHLIAARASFRLGNIDEAKEQLGKAESVEADAGVAVELTQAELQLSAGNYEQALATLVRARANAAKHPYVLALLARAHRHLGEWDALRPLLPELRKYGLLEDVALRGLEGELWHALIRSIAEQSNGSVKDLEVLWRDMPRAQREQLPLRICYLDALITLCGYGEAEKHIVSWLGKDWQPELVAFLGRFPPDNPRKLLKIVRKWLDAPSHDGVLLLAVARVALHAGDWETAGTWLEQAHQRGATPENCCELARFCAARGDHERASALSAEAVGLSLAPLPEVPLPDSKEGQ
ncbi:heme biosynthesis HemY N-terminal domain-containing protein [Luminiphilus sp. nBUS_07]|uniref:heme biosynthesis HemY N-terminal domain-containing protein n=1 Tax=Luminiphilus sp. nBUS_07 TaxID=3395314 RepID=UPI003EB84995